MEKILKVNEDSNSSSEELRDNADDLEGIIQNEPQKNKYETVKYHKMNKFPYCLIGRVVSKFEINGINKYLNGVGILIGPDVVLTVAHNLCHMIPNSTTVIDNKKVIFFSSCNSDFKLFDPVKSTKTFINDEYIKSLKEDDKDNQLLNDWGLVYLSVPIGDMITSLLEIKDQNEVIVDKKNGLYNYFCNNKNLNYENIISKTNSTKISIVGYTEFKEKYKNNSAYKFLSDLKNKNVNLLDNKTDKTNNSNNTIEEEEENLQKLQSSNKQYKIMNDIDKFKKINININIKEDLSEGVITASSHYYKNNEKDNGIDYIVLGENGEEYNQNFDINKDKNKQIMSESKGILLSNDEEVNKNIIKYQISTYKGQSGSPIFLRYKRVSQNNNPNNAISGFSFHNANRSRTCSIKTEYVYQFLGLHSRRGPTHNFYESERMSELTENLCICEGMDQKFTENIMDNSNSKFGLINSTNNAKDLKEKILDKDNNNEYDLFSINSINNNNVKNNNNNNCNNQNNNNNNQQNNNNNISMNISLSNIVKIDEESNQKDSVANSTKKNEILMLNGICDYNLAVNILGKTVENIASFVYKEMKSNKKVDNQNGTNNSDNTSNMKTSKELSSSNSSESNEKPVKKPKSEFIYTKLLLNGEIKFTGLFKRGVTLSTIFGFGSKILNVPKEYILLQDAANPMCIQNYNFDHDKKLCEVLDDPKCSTSISFELLLNFKKYGEFLANNILQKFMENYDLEEEQLKKDFNKYMKGLFHLIFREINTFENLPVTYGKLFKKIRKIILTKLQLKEDKK